MKIRAGWLGNIYKRGSDFSNVTNDVLENIMVKLNNRPRKSLGYATPNDIFCTSTQAV